MGFVSYLFEKTNNRSRKREREREREREGGGGGGGEGGAVVSSQELHSAAAFTS